MGVGIRRGGLVWVLQRRRGGAYGVCESALVVVKLAQGVALWAEGAAAGVAADGAAG